MARARGIAITRAQEFTDSKGEKVKYYEPVTVQIEEPWRAFNQLKNLVIALATLRRKGEVDMEDCGSLNVLVIPTAPVDRAEALNILIKYGKLTAKGVASYTEKSSKTAGRRLNELVMLGLASKAKADDMIEKSPWEYTIKEAYRTIFGGMDAPQNLTNFIDF